MKVKFILSNLFFLGPKTPYPKCKSVILVFKGKNGIVCILQFSREIEVSVSKNKLFSILLCFLYKFKSGYMQNIIFFTKQEDIFSVLRWLTKRKLWKVLWKHPSEVCGRRLGLVKLIKVPCKVLLKKKKSKSFRNYETFFILLCLIKNRSKKG